MALVGMVCLAAGMTGCSTTGRHVRSYDGPPRPAGQVARLKLGRSSRGPSALVWSIDGRDLRQGRKWVWNTTAEIELTPGSHAVELSYWEPGLYSISNVTLAFVCEAGHGYELHVAPLDEGVCETLWKMTVGGRFRWTAWIIDAQTKAVVAGWRREEVLHWYE